ncbi:MAG: Gfo/Idh/MocA family oxidoreductase [Abitibacteriaceae bacterium]|nr:Gfo/Idh/MocA family oxidoreductase [Abditibacteriaceae bacterium]MBV9866233.1 Gfo/Idh/MocA family oxidoreductase [Abditibacteriaceae bacterium]
MTEAIQPIRVGIVGLGRSGWSIHQQTLKDLKDRYEIVAVADVLAARLEEAQDAHGYRTYSDLAQLVSDDEVELVVVATPNRFHASHALQALEAGKHVVCEKPFGFTVADVDAMIAASQKHGVVLQPFQQRRYEPDMRKVKEICESGLLGDITFIGIAWHGFKRRWDWQTSRAFGGGELYNNGPHLIDHALDLFGAAEPQVAWCELRRSLNSGDAEDEVRIILSGDNAPTVQVELTATTAFPQERWHVCGTSGGLRGDGDKLVWRWVDWSQMPPRPQDLQPTPDRSYNSEELKWQEASWERGGQADAGAGAAPAQQPVVELYHDLWRTIREGTPQVITPQSVRRRVAVLEECYRQSGVPFPEGARTHQ